MNQCQLVLEKKLLCLHIILNYILLWGCNNINLDHDSILIISSAQEVAI